MKMKRWMLPAGVAVILALAVGAFVFGQNAVTSKASKAPTTTTTLPADFVEFKDEAGFSLWYPGGWKRYESDDPQVRLLVAPNDRDSFQVRVVQLSDPVTKEGLLEVKKLTDQVVTAGEGVEPVGEPQQIDIAGVPGWYYLYRFTDTASGEQGIHSHYFLFRGDTLITFVFQALPESAFSAHAPVFDQIVSTFKVTKAKGKG